MIQTVFFGTNEFAARTLEGLVRSPFLNVELVITQPDKPVGRKQTSHPPAVKVMAEKYNIPLDQPNTLKSYQLAVTNCPIAVLEKYGVMIPDHIINAFPLGIINVHPSLLPKYRGPSPYQTAIMNGDVETGVTIMKLSKEMDAGPILAQISTPIDPDETAVDLEKKLAEIGLQLLLDTLPKYVSGTIEPISQDEKKVTYTHLFTRDTGKINWQKTTAEIYNQYRALTSWPGVWTTWQGKRLKLLQIKPSNTKIQPGQVQWADGSLNIGTKDGSVQVISLQLEGKQVLTPKIFMNGNPTFHNALVH